ncbi:hypothetical protein NDA16_000869 [Ustilago loliicola]|nr:hypothetical protein NDA16_000869 [Ustilago loliicola]
MTATLFQASKDDNVELVSSLLEEPSLDIDARDETGLTALHHAVRTNHVDVVSQLLAKGANAIEVTEDAALKQNPELASIINNALQHTQSAAFQSAPVVDPHGGKQLPDGTVSYVQPPAYQGHQIDASMQQQHQQQQHAMHHPMAQPMYPFQPQHAYFDPSHNPEHRAHANKDSFSGSLPPPEVARMIPCRFFPNCRYADKCIFAHPVAMPISASNAGPVSPGQAPMFYQSHAYGYPPYGPPQHFYSMAPPMPLQYNHAGVPMPLHMPPPPNMAPAPHSSEQADVYGIHFAAQSHHQQNQVQEGEAETTKQEVSQMPAAAASSQADGDDEKSAPAGESTSASADAEKSSAPTNSMTTTTSFSAFMAHHAAPFQPGPGAQNGVSVGADGSILTGSQNLSRGPKGARRGGASMGGSFGSRADFSKRSTERPACHFFARSACKHSEDCRFPHILPDGTDARGPNAGRSNHSIEASRTINRALAAKNAKSSTNGSQANGANAAQPSQAASSTAVNGESSNLPSASTDVTVSTSPASAQTTITPAMKAEAAAKPSTDKAASSGEAADKSAATASTSTNNAAAPAAAPKKDPANANKSNGVAAPASAPKAGASNTVSASKPETKAENANNGKRAPAAGKTEEAKPASTLPTSTNGDRIPALIPSKPMVNGNGGNAANRPNGIKPQPNGVHADKGPQQQNQHQNQNGARARTNQGPNGRANGQVGQNGAQQKKAAPQRLPSADDFPALGNKNGAAAAPSAPASTANGIAKANFSAILSAPAPVKKQPEPTKETEAPAAADEKAAPAEAKESSTSNNEAETKSNAAKQSPPAANGTAAPMLDFAAVVQSNPVAV